MKVETDSFFKITIQNLKIIIKIQWKKTEIIGTIESDYKVKRRVFQSLSDIAENLFEYIHSLDQNEIQELGSDIKANGWGVESISEIQDAQHLLFFNFFTTTMGDLLLLMDYST